MAARNTPVRKAWRSLTWLLVIVAVLGGLNGAGMIFDGAAPVPKLALDLEGGTEIILAPKIAEGAAQPTSDQLNQAVSIIRQRVDASGVSEAEINTQGGQNVVVSIPGVADQATIDRIESSAKLEFRAVLQTDAASNTSAGPTPAPTASTTATDGATPGADATTPSTTPTPSGTPTENTTEPKNASDPAWITPELAAKFASFDCSSAEENGANVADPDKPLITCDDPSSLDKGQQLTKYILGPVEVSGETISDASAGQVPTSQGAVTGQWAVNIVFNSKGAKEFGDVTTRLYTLTGARHQFAIVLDGQVISAPTTNAVITNGKPQITGNFTQATAKTLADQLKFGALPIGFQVQSKNQISATLGSTQLQSGLLAGLIGLILVVIYSLFQYRLLGLVTVASLVVAATITYLFVTLLSWREGYRLSLAGVAGLIVAIGITADSFIVYFERIRDELRDGRALPSAVEAGWKRAIRTVLASDTVNFLAAGILFIVAVGNVKGFALTLGITTIIDIVVVALFTHPVLQLLSRTAFFSEGHRFSGLDPKALGAVYRGRASFREPVGVSAAKKASSAKEAARRQTIAERKAAEQNKPGTKGKDS
ncbi:protein translocase subunit SecD [Parafrigoribacterium humi]|uniref:protein translocase subunit SecD n=1 Tax=Parafrigoribacterium humi TaxID=3144664 RepID=UPI0032EE916E